MTSLDDQIMAANRAARGLDFDRSALAAAALTLGELRAIRKTEFPPAWPLLPRQERIAIETIVRHRVASTEMIANAIYADNEYGGALNAFKGVHVIIFRIRKRLGPHGVVIESDRGRGASGYRLSRETRAMLGLTA